jgi:RNA-directed DNA polymerase
VASRRKATFGNDRYARGVLIESAEKRASDGRVLRLIQKWIKIGVIEDGKMLMSETEMRQGQPIGPLLANIYLQHALDVWLEEMVKPCLKGEATKAKTFQTGKTKSDSTQEQR